MARSNNTRTLSAIARRIVADAAAERRPVMPPSVAAAIARAAARMVVPERRP